MWKRNINQLPLVHTHVGTKPAQACILTDILLHRMTPNQQSHTSQGSRCFQRDQWEYSIDSVVMQTIWLGMEIWELLVYLCDGHFEQGWGLLEEQEPRQQRRGSKTKCWGTPISNGWVGGRAAQKPEQQKLDRNLFQEGSSGQWCLTLLRVSLDEKWKYLLDFESSDSKVVLQSPHAGARIDRKISKAWEIGDEWRPWHGLYRQLFRNKLVLGNNVQI